MSQAQTASTEAPSTNASASAAPAAETSTAGAAPAPSPPPATTSSPPATPTSVGLPRSDVLKASVAKLLESRAAREKGSGSRAGSPVPSTSGAAGTGRVTTTTPAGTAASGSPSTSSASSGAAAAAESATTSAPAEKPDRLAERLALVLVEDERVKAKEAAVAADREALKAERAADAEATALGKAILELQTKDDRVALIKAAFKKGTPMGEILMAVAAAQDDEAPPATMEEAARREVQRLEAERLANEKKAKDAATAAEVAARDASTAELVANSSGWLNAYLARPEVVEQLKSNKDDPNEVRRALIPFWENTIRDLEGAKDKFPGITTFGMSREAVDEFVMTTYASKGKAPTRSEALEHIEKGHQSRIESHPYARRVESAQGETSKLPPQTVTSAWQRGATPSAELPAPQTLEEKRDALLRSKGWKK